MRKNLFALERSLATVMATHERYFDHARAYYRMITFTAEELRCHMQLSTEEASSTLASNPPIASLLRFTEDEYRALLPHVNSGSASKPSGEAKRKVQGEKP